MGQGNSSTLQEPIENLHSELMRHAGADYDIATAGTLTYNQFLKYITRLNEICREYKDDEGRLLVFAVKKGSDVTMFWKMTVRIACVKLDSTNNTVVSHRLLNIRQFLQIFRRITYECTEGRIGQSPAQESQSTDEQEPSVRRRLPPTVAASMILGENAAQSAAGGQNTDTQSSSSTQEQDALDECVICMERKPEVILPCAHAYCLPCIEQWWEYSTPTQDECASSIFAFSTNVVDKTCPVCRESLQSADDTWVISDTPDDCQVNQEIRKALMCLADSESKSSNQ